VKNILIINLLPLHKIIEKDNFKNDIPYFNKMLKYNSEKFYNKYSDLNIFIYNICKKIEYIINNCNKYSFKSCISKGEKDQKNLFYGWLHLSELGNKLITDDINNFLNFISN